MLKRFAASLNILYPAALGILLSAVFSISGAQAQQSQDERERTQQQLEALQSEIAERQEALARRRTELSRSQRQLRDIEQEINTATQQLSATERELFQTRRQIESLENEQLILQDQLAEQAELLADQIDAAYRAGNYQILELLLNQSDPGRVERLMEYYRYMNAARLEELQALHEREEELRDVQQRLANAKVQLENEQAQQTRQRNALNAQKAEREQQIARIQNASATDEERLTALHQSVEELTELLISLAEASRNVPVQLEGLANRANTLAGPVTGDVRYQFGETQSGEVRWSGMVIGAEAETPVRNVADGRVLFADWLRGFGLLLVIDHGEGYMSLYGYNQALLYDVGETVRAVETVALVGKSGGQREPGLYFEIRHRGRALNPNQYLR